MYLKIKGIFFLTNVFDILNVRSLGFFFSLSPHPLPPHKVYLHAIQASMRMGKDTKFSPHTYVCGLVAVV